MGPTRLLVFPSVRAISVCARSVASATRQRFSYQQRPNPRPIFMANVTKGDFWETCEQLETHLRAADFVALDFEMTGVETSPWRRSSELDTCETRYQHFKHSAESFAVWQCGVCPFKWDELGQKFVAYPYNFFIFPRNELPVEMPGRSFFCQTASLEFLAKHHFDFNTTVYHGISYLSLEQEEVAKSRLGLTEEALKRRRKNLESESEIPLTRTGDVVFSERLRVQLGLWRDGLLRSRQQGHDPSNGSAPLDPSGAAEVSSRARVGANPDQAGFLSTPEEGEIAANVIPAGGRPSYFVDITGNNQARLVKQVVRKHFPDLVPFALPKVSNEDRKQVRISFTSSEEDKAKFLEELEEEHKSYLEAVLRKAVGFRKVIDAIKAAGKPLIGHNCFLDLAHLHDKFLGPLPSSMAGFSASILRHFPCVLDTKYLLKTEPTLREANVNKVTSLAIAYQELCQGFPDKAGIPATFYSGRPKIVGRPMSRVKLEIATEFQRYASGKDTGLKHEAGFDAYMTGAIFAQLCHILQVDVSVLHSLPQATLDGEMGFASYANLLMLKTFKAQLALDLNTGCEAIGMKAPPAPMPPSFRLPERENVAIFWGLPFSQSHDQFLRRILQSVFEKENRLSTIDVHFIDESSAFVEFRSSSILENFFHTFQASGDAMTLILTSGTGGSAIRAARFEVYEQLCRSPLATESLGIAADLLGLNQLVPISGYIGSETVAQAILEQSLSKSTGGPLKVADVSSETQLTSSLLGQGVDIGKTDTKDIAADSNDRRMNEQSLSKSTSGDMKECDVGSKRQLTSSLLDGGVGTGKTDSKNIGTGSKDRRINTKVVVNAPQTFEDGSCQVNTGTAAANRHNTCNGEEGVGQISETSYSKWMKRVFDDNNSGAAVNPGSLRVSKRPRDNQNEDVA